MLTNANKYMHITTPYLLIDNDLSVSIENAALRRMDAGVKIYEYKSGFIHAKSYVSDNKYAMIGTINLDYRNLVHLFENSVWMYDCDSIKSIKKDIDETIEKSIRIMPNMLKTPLINRFMRSIARIFSSLL